MRNTWGGGEVFLPNVSYCNLQNEVHYNPLKTEPKALKFSANGTQTILLSHDDVGENAPVLEYSLDKGTTWTSWNYSAITFGSGGDLYIRGNNPEGFSSSPFKFSQFVFGNDTEVECHGNVMHLLSYEEDLLIIPSNYCFYRLFYNCTSLVTAPELPATTLTDSCYELMFSDCTSLTIAPELPATTLADKCYFEMFRFCDSLATAPELPATTLSQECYHNMFRSCRSLTAAPELPATILTMYCYQEMFSDCTSLNYVKCLATDISASSCLSNWMSGVHSGGTFVKKAGVTYPSGKSGIPSGWTVEEV